MKTLLLCCCLIIAGGTIQAQHLSHQVLANGGASMGNSRGDVISWSIGEMMIATYSQSDFTLTQGFHQAENLTITSVYSSAISNLELNIFPNPAIDRFFVEVKGAIETAPAILYNLLGVPLQRVTIAGRTEVNLGHLPSGIYLLQVALPDGQVQSFKIQKQ